MMRLTKLSVVAVVAGSVSLIGGAMADTTGNMTVDTRIAAMKEMGKNMKAIAAVAKGQAEYTVALKDNAAQINRIAKTIPDLFKEKVIMEGSRAKSEIWASMDDYKTKAEALATVSSALIAAVSTGDQGKIGAALGATGKNCGACHKLYRVPKK